MRTTFLRISGTAAGAALGAGLASALLSMLVVRHTPLAVAVGFVAPLPIMVAALGFGPLAGLIAAVSGAFAVGIFDVRPGELAITQFDRLDAAALDVLVYLAGVALPAWLMARTAILAPSQPRASTGIGKTPLRADERMLGAILTLAVGFAALSVILDLIVAALKVGGFGAFIAATVDKAEPIVDTLLTSRRTLPKGVDMHQVAVIVTWAQMPLMAAAEVVLLVANLWVAARIAQASDLLGKSWPDIPGHTRVPRPLALVLAVALGLSVAGGIVGAVGLVISGALVMAFAFQGLAVLHTLTRGKGYRFPLLIIVYLTMAILMPWLLVGYGLLGLVDTVVAFRDRQKPIVVKKT